MTRLSYSIVRACFLALLLIAIPLRMATGQSDSGRSDSPVMQSKLAARKSPMGALLRSVAVPGWGQFYNRKYVKSAVVFGTETFFIAKAVRWWQKTEDQYHRVLVTTDWQQKSLEFDRYLSHRTRRDDYLWAVGITIFVSMFDAYVDAHLSGFDIDLTPDFNEPQGGGSVTLSFRF